MSQFNAFCKAAEYAKRVEQAALISAVNVGSHGDAKKAVTGLTDGNG